MTSKRKCRHCRKSFNTGKPFSGHLAHCRARPRPLNSQHRQLASSTLPPTRVKGPAPPVALPLPPSLPVSTPSHSSSVNQKRGRSSSTSTRSKRRKNNKGAGSSSRNNGIRIRPDSDEEETDLRPTSFDGDGGERQGQLVTSSRESSIAAGELARPSLTSSAVVKSVADVVFS